MLEVRSAWRFSKSLGFLCLSYHAGISFRVRFQLYWVTVSEAGFLKQHASKP